MKLVPHNLLTSHNFLNFQQGVIPYGNPGTNYLGNYYN